MALFKAKYNTGRDVLSHDTMLNGARLITAAEPKNQVSEQFRIIRTNIEFASVSKGNVKTVMVSSALSSEGKSTITANLAVVYAQQGKKVLLVDTDLRRPTVATTFGITDDHGLTNYLANLNSDTQSIIHHTRMDTLDVVTSGPVPPNPAELLASSRMTNLISELRSQYDLVFFDVPPFLMVTDAQVLMSKIDGVVIVVSGRQTTRGALQRTMDMLKLSDGPILGFIYNDRNRKKNSVNGYGYGYGIK
ncbi:CpsD/CapB family tyrosine-protein kinase [Leuconostoc lactis]|uniref:CpsD/CapB family tyrosine-protein kinase n=1 Tax=Leuconostoc lactis TaxID=1246 RepID=UPI0025B1F592|nr:CpsD/CapB family tyrosine-protein kinase [Leuconostoc lactis]MDN2649363.1 CpsD/CapB family tyrosine-protein kinase [Leuconostoc lactis]